MAPSQWGSLVFFFVTLKSVSKKLNPRKRFRPWAKVTEGPSQGPVGPGKFPVLNPVSQPACMKRAFALGVTPSGRSWGGWHGFGAAGSAASLPQGIYRFLACVSPAAPGGEPHGSRH